MAVQHDLEAAQDGDGEAVEPEVAAQGLGGAFDPALDEDLALAVAVEAARGAGDAVVRMGSVGFQRAWWMNL